MWIQNCSFYLFDTCTNSDIDSTDLIINIDWSIDNVN